MITIENVSKAFGERQVLRECTLRVEEGQTMVVIGSSGSSRDKNGHTVRMKLRICQAKTAGISGGL